MKPHAIRERFGRLFTLAALGLLACFTAFSFIHYRIVRTEYIRASQYLDDLKGQTPILTPENLAEATEANTAYSQALQALQSEFHPYPLDNTLTPQQFQDRLRRAVSDTISAADMAQVQLPASFYLGFDQYQNRLPSNEAAPQLGQELEAITAFVQKLIAIRVGAINALVRHPLQIEGDNASSAPTLTIFPIAVSFTADEPRIREAFNWLISPPQFTIIRALKIRNNTPEGPHHQKISLDPPASSANITSQSNRPQLNLILGREKITAEMQLEFVKAK